jgi:hypothetical protein
MVKKIVESKDLAIALQKHRGNKAKAAKSLGITRQAVQDRIKHDPIVKSAWQKFVDTLEKVGGTNIKIAKTIVAALDAETTKSVGFGEDRELVKEPDHYARLKATDQCLKIKRLIGEEPEKNPEEKHLHLHLKDKTSDELFAFIMSHLAERERQQSKIQIEPSSGL